MAERTELEVRLAGLDPLDMTAVDLGSLGEALLGHSHLTAQPTYLSGENQLDP